MTIYVYIDYVFIGLLIIELMTKLISSSWKDYLKDIWYWVDLFNVIVS